MSGSFFVTDSISGLQARGNEQSISLGFQGEAPASQISWSRWDIFTDAIERYRRERVLSRCVDPEVLVYLDHAVNKTRSAVNDMSAAVDSIARAVRDVRATEERIRTTGA